MGWSKWCPSVGHEAVRDWAKREGEEEGEAGKQKGASPPKNEEWSERKEGEIGSRRLTVSLTYI